MAGYRLVASDLDGTLLTNDQTLSPENAAAIREMTRRGIQFALSTGRTYGELLPALRDNPDIRWYILSDGALIYDKKEDKRHTTCIRGELQELVLDTLFGSACWFTLHNGGVSYYDGAKVSPEDFQYHNVPPYFQALVKQWDEPVLDFEPFCRGVDEIEQISVFFHSEQELARCRQIFQDTGLVETAWASSCYMELYHAQAGKGRGLVKLARILGIDPQETIAIGDTANDSSIIQAAGLGLATDNAKPELKAIADDVICSNEDHVAAYVLEHYL